MSQVHRDGAASPEVLSDEDTEVFAGRVNARKAAKAGDAHAAGAQVNSTAAQAGNSPLAQSVPGADVSSATPATAPRAGGEQVGTRMPFHAVSAGAPRAATGGPKHRGKGKGAQPAATPATALSALQENRIDVAHAMQKLATQGTVRGADGAAPASWSAATTIVWSKGLEGMGDVHGRPSKKSVAAAQACSHLECACLCCRSLRIAIIGAAPLRYPRARRRRRTVTAVQQLAAC